jgi:hypothetical protein
VADDTYPEELYVDEIEIFDYDDFWYWSDGEFPDPDEWGSEYFAEYESTETERDTFDDY